MPNQPVPNRLWFLREGKPEIPMVLKVATRLGIAATVASAAFFIYYFVSR